MKKSFILFIVLLRFFVLKATTYYGIYYQFSHTYSPSNDSLLHVVIHLNSFTEPNRTDSFDIQSNYVKLKRYSFSDNFNISGLGYEIFDRNHKLLDAGSSPTSLNVSHCNGFIINNIFNGNNCVSLNAFNTGTLCGSITLNYTRDDIENAIQTEGGHFSRKFDIYCTLDLKSSETSLKLKPPCPLLFLNSGNNLKWYESADTGKSWQFLDTGLFIYPAKLSYHGGIFYNKSRLYKVVADTQQMKGISQYSSDAIGPFRFYLGMHLDSIQKKSGSCAAQKDVLIHFKNDTFVFNNAGPRIWAFYLHPDSSKEYRYQLTNVGFSPVKLANRTWINQSVSPNVYTSLPLKKGRYRIMYDFTPWNGFDCKLFFDTFYLTEDFNTNFKLSLREIQKNTCFGDQKAAIEISSSGTDTSARNWSPDGNNWHRTPDTLRNQSSGKFIFLLKNNLNCITQDSIKIKSPDAFFHSTHIDTTLCIGQRLFVDLHHPNARYYEVRSDTGIIAKTDTFSLTHSGNFIVTTKDSNACVHQDSLKIVRKNIEVLHDFLIPTKAFLSDTVFAVDVSIPASDKAFWKFSDNRIQSAIFKKTTNQLQFPDTGKYSILLHGRYSGCGFSLSKTITIVGNKDSSKISGKYGYKGPLIQKFEIDPNPNDGQNFKIKVTLRDTADIVVYKIDPISGDIVGDIDFYKKKYYEFTAFKSYAESVFFLKLVAGNESKTNKVVVIP